MKLKELLVVSTAGLALSCSTPESTEISHFELTPEPTTYSLTPAEQLEEQHNAAIAALPEAACSTDRRDEKKAREIAERCHNAQQHGRVALVNFGAESELLEAVADDMEIAMPAATAGIVTPSVSVVAASPESKTAFDETNPQCAIVDPKKFASVMADIHMPQLQQNYDFVIAITDKPACVGDLGLSDNVVGRHADIYKKGIEEIANTLPDPSEKLEDMLVHDTAHELGHLLGMNHKGTLQCEITKGGKSYSLADHHIAPAPNTFDLKRYAKPTSQSCTYKEYSDQPDVLMGSNNYDLKPQDYKPDGLEVERLTSLATANQDSTLATSVSEKTTIYDGAAAKAYKHATIALTAEAGFSVMGWRGAAVQMSELAFVPIVGEGSAKNDAAVSGVRLVMQGLHYETIDMGVLAEVSTGESKTMLVSVGREVVRIALDGKTMSTTLIK